MPRDFRKLGLPPSSSPSKDQDDPKGDFKLSPSKMTTGGFSWLQISDKKTHKVVSHIAAAAAKLLQSRPTLCNPIDGSPPGSPVPGILQARTLEWVANSFSNAWKWKVKVKSLSRFQLLAWASFKGPSKNMETKRCPPPRKKRSRSPSSQGSLSY